MLFLEYTSMSMMKNKMNDIRLKVKYMNIYLYIGIHVPSNNHQIHKNASMKNGLSNNVFFSKK